MPPLPRPHLLRSRVAQRLLGLFVACALLPTLALAAVAFTTVRGQLEEGSRRRLHETSKAIGLAIHERLLFLESALKPLAARLHDSRPGSAQLPAELIPHLQDRFEAMALVRVGGGRTLLFGDDPGAPRLSEIQREHLAAGGAVVTTLHPERGPSRVVLVVAVDDASWLVADVLPQYLFAPALDSVDSEGHEFCVLDEAHRVIACSTRDGMAVPAELRERLARSTSGSFEWRRTDEAYLGQFWALFLKSRFATPRWTVVLGEARSEVFASLHRFTTSFALIVGASLLAVLLLSTGQIRRSLIPLRRLQEGTRRVASQDFDVSVDVRSGDEFQDLAEAFNAMARRLGRQFHALAARNELDRAILSAMDLQTILDAVLERVPALCPCDAVSVIVLEGASSTSARSHLAEPGAAGRRQRDDVVVGLDAVASLESGSELVVQVAQRPVPSYLMPLVHRGMRSILALPILSGGQLTGILALGSRAADAVWEERLHAQQLADQVAVAFANARMLERVRFLAYHDPLTKLPNRRRFTEDLTQALDRARRRGASLAVIFFDLDDFKRVNDTLGHGVGDELLRSVARRVRDRVVRASRAQADFELARLGGDEFTLLAADLDSMEEASAIAEQLLRALTEPFRLGSHEVFVSASIGMAMYPFDGDEAGALMKNADTAMHAAKDLGKNRFQFYTRSMNEAAVERVTLEGQLRRALERSEFELYYQPIIDIRSGRLAGAEALLRWNHPDVGLVLPDAFIRVAEEMGLIVPLGEWILQRACRTARRWQREGRGDVSVAVNLSGRQFREEKLVDTVARALTAAGLRPELLALELTESMLMRAD